MNEPTPRQIAVRKAIFELNKHGLRIGMLKCHPETMHEIVSEYVTTSLINVTEISKSTGFAVPKYLPHSYMGIPLEQEV